MSPFSYSWPAASRFLNRKPFRSEWPWAVRNEVKDESKRLSPTKSRVMSKVLTWAKSKVLSKGWSSIRVKPMPAWLYILRLKSGQLYIGSTTDMDQRYEDHCSGRACRTTKLDPPIAHIFTEEYQTFSEARKREAQIKRWTRAKKEALVSRDLTKLKQLSKKR